MKIETKFNVGDEVYYIFDHEIKIAKIFSFKIQYLNYSKIILTDYIVKSSDKSLNETRLEENVLFNTVSGLLTHLYNKYSKELSDKRSEKLDNLL